MDEKVRVRRPHRLNMEDRKRIDFTGITDVVSFDPVKVILESDYGHITIKGEGLHVNRLSVEKGELDLDGRVDSICYSESGMKNKQDSFMSRLLRLYIKQWGMKRYQRIWVVIPTDIFLCVLNTDLLKVIR